MPGSPARPSPANPYVGPRAFETGERRYFFGRDEETTILEGLVMARRAALFFAQSGAGKSSLLRAGLIPSLTRQETIGRGQRARTYQKMRVLPVASVGGGIPVALDKAVGNVFVLSALLSLLPEADPAALSSLALSDGLRTVLEHLPSSQAPAQSDAATDTLLIFDQFEELFTHHVERWAERADFFRQVTQALDGWPQLHVLFTMREDYIAELTPFVGLLPEQLRPRFRLERLKGQAALDAVKRPAEQAGRSFGPGVAEALAANLSRSQPGRLPAASSQPSPAQQGAGQIDYVEPVHLQIVCRQLWANLPPERTVIQAEDVQAFGDVDQALMDFYNGAVREAVAETGYSERRLRSWFDEHLITPAQTRGLVYRGESDTEGLPNATVGVLNDAYIIRATIRGGDTWYELAHDRLVDPVLRANQAWLAAYHNPLMAATQTWLAAGRDPGQLLPAKQLAAAERFAAAHPGDLTEDEAAFLQESRRQAKDVARRQRNTILAVAVAMVILALLATWGWLNYTRAQANFQEAQRQTELSQSRELAAASMVSLETDPLRGILLALRGMQVAHTPETEDALHRAILASRLQLNLRGHEAEVTDAAFSPDGQRIATASVDGTVRLWDASTGEMLASQQGEGGTLTGVAFSPDGQRIATAAQDGTLLLWSGDLSGKLAELDADPAGALQALAFSPDGRDVAAAGDDGRFRVWDVATGELAVTCAAHLDAILGLAYSSDGQRIATASRDGTAQVWDAGCQGESLVLAGHQDGVEDVAFSPDGRRIATASRDQTARLWDAATGEPLQTLYGHTNWVMGVAFSPDGQRIATASWDRSARVWDAATGRPLFNLMGHTGWVRRVAFSPDGRRLVTAGEDRLAKVWNAFLTQELLTIPAHAGRANALAFKDDGTILATGGEDGWARVWDAATGQLLASFQHPSAVLDVAFSPDGTELATGTAAGSIEISPVGGGEPRLTIPRQPGQINAVAFSPDGQWLASASSDGSAHVWRTQDGSQVAAWQRQSGTLFDVAFSPDGERVATAAGDGSFAIWDPRTGASELLVAAHDQEVYHLAYSPDGTLLATGGVDQTAKVWQAAGGQLLRTLAGHTDRVHSVAFEPDGRANGPRLATASWDQTVKVWEPESGVLLLTLLGHDSRVWDVAFVPGDGPPRVASAGEDGTVRFYLLDAQDLMEMAWQRARPLLTQEECQQILPPQTCTGG